MTSISRPTLCLLAGALLFTGCPSDDSSDPTVADDDTTGDTSAGSSATTTTTSSTTATTGPTTDPTTDPSTDPATTDPSTTPTTDPTDATTTDDVDTSASADTGVGDCAPTGVPCDDCLIVDHCCAEFLACTADEGCDCVVICMMAGGSGEACGAECKLDAPPPELDALFGCFDSASCGDVCM